MDLIAQTFHFFPTYENTTIWNDTIQGYIGDVEEMSQSVRMFGTKNQIKNTLEHYMNKHTLMLDEVHNYKVESKGSYWYEHPCYKGKFHEEMKQIQNNLKEYKKLWEQKKNAVVIKLR
tara:strand:- start:449 stop:802 length:354 start_codon:yes stop_codon:yes gene_type:complete